MIASVSNQFPFIIRFERFPFSASLRAVSLLDNAGGSSNGADRMDCKGSE